MTILRFIPQAFVGALITVEKELPGRMNTAIQQVYQNCQGGNILSLTDLEEIAKQDGDFYQLYKSAYIQLLAIDQGNEKNKHINDPSPFPIQPGEDKEPNILAPLGPILGDDNPAQKAKSIFGASSLKHDMATAIEWCSQNIRLS